MGADAREFENLLRPVLDVAYGVAYRLVGNRADAEDLVQEAALNAHRGFGTFRPGTNFKAWFLRIMTNCFYARGRRSGPAEEVPVEDTPPLFLLQRVLESGLGEGSEDPATIFFRKLESEKIADAMSSLPEPFRVVVTLHFMDDLKYAEIAEMLDLPVGTVRSRLHRSRRMLQKALWDRSR